jgi:hypothetical protein
MNNSKKAVKNTHTVSNIYLKGFSFIDGKFKSQQNTIWVLDKETGFIRKTNTSKISIENHWTKTDLHENPNYVEEIKGKFEKHFSQIKKCFENETLLTKDLITYFELFVFSHLYDTRKGRKELIGVAIPEEHFKNNVITANDFINKLKRIEKKELKTYPIENIDPLEIYQEGYPSFCDMFRRKTWIGIPFETEYFLTSDSPVLITRDDKDIFETGIVILPISKKICCIDIPKTYEKYCPSVWINHRDHKLKQCIEPNINRLIFQNAKKEIYSSSKNLLEKYKLYF